jgi:hypothetical protein
LDGSKYAAEGCGREWESIDAHLTRARGREEFLVAARTSIAVDVGCELGWQTERVSIKSGWIL